VFLSAPFGNSTRTTMDLARSSEQPVSELNKRAAI
jgi:hypothetical protein